MRQGRTDAWIAHQLDVSVGDIRSFKRDHELAPDTGDAEGDAAGVGELDEPDLRAEDDALVAAALEAEAEEVDDEPEDDDGDAGRAPTTTTATSRASAAAGAVAGAGGASARARSRAPSTTATRATGSGSTPRCRTTPSTPSTGPAIGP